MPDRTIPPGVPPGGHHRRVRGLEADRPGDGGHVSEPHDSWESDDPLGIAGSESWPTHYRALIAAAQAARDESHAAGEAHRRLVAELGALSADLERRHGEAVQAVGAKGDAILAAVVDLRAHVEVECRQLRERAATAEARLADVTGERDRLREGRWKVGPVEAPTGATLHALALVLLGVLALLALGGEVHAPGVDVERIGAG